MYMNKPYSVFTGFAVRLPTHLISFNFCSTFFSFMLLVGAHPLSPRFMFEAGSKPALSTKMLPPKSQKPLHNRVRRLCAYRKEIFMDKSLKIEYIPLTDIKPYEKNAKMHPETQIQQIKNSILEFGFKDPIAVWKDNVIIEGHGRYLAAQELEYKEVPIIRLDELSDEQRKAYMLAHNKLTMNSGFDFDILSEELDSILDIDMTDFGFDDLEELSQDDLDGVFGDYEEKPPKEPEEIQCPHCKMWFKK